MTITNQQRNHAYENASDIQKSLYASPESGEALWKIAETYGLTNDSVYTQFVVTVGDVVLGLLPADELISKLSTDLSINQDKATAIILDVQGFLLPLQNNKATPKFEPASPNLANDIAEAEEALKAIPHIRTMANDIEEASSSHIPTYTSTQEAILREGKTETTPTVPRWSSEQ